ILSSIIFYDSDNPQYYTLSLHDALPIFCLNHPVDDGLTRRHARLEGDVHFRHASLELVLDRDDGGFGDLGDGETGGLDLLRRDRSEEHTSELQSRGHVVCRLLLEKKQQL